MFRVPARRPLLRILLPLSCLAAASAQEPPAPPLELGIEDAVLLALQNSPELAFERLEPERTRSFEGEERALFDPLLIAEDVGWQRVRGQKLRGLGILERFETDSPVGRLAMERLLPTGTGVALEAGTEVSDESLGRQLVQSRVGLTVFQALLRDRGPAANLGRVRAARLDTTASAYELRAFTETFVATVEQTCWDYLLFRRQEAILDEMTALAERTLEETEARVRIGTSARVEVAAARAEVSLRNQQRIDAASDALKARMGLVRLLNPGGPDPFGREIVLRTEFLPPGEAPEPVGAQVAGALRMRPEIHQARTLVERGEVEVVRTRNGLLPRMDLFVTLGRSGYADSFRASWDALDDSDDDDVLAGLRFEFPVRRSEARARHGRALTEKAQADRAVENLKLLVEAEVRIARIELERARQQIAAAATTRALDEEKLAAETQKFAIARASAFQVARAQRDLTRSRLDEATAVAEAHKALVELHRLEGSLLSRRGIEVPGT